ncbi:MAG: flagellar biosynthesis regulator FlaF [Pseudomonadota bacterium]
MLYSSHLAQNAYSQPSSPVRSDRGTEYAAFERITAQLKKAELGATPYRAQVEAIHANRRLWTILATDVFDVDNGLSPEMRAQIVYLHEFTQSHSRAVLRNGASLEPLIDVNTAIMRGLRGEKGTP